jgi:cytochrome b subunit of formate dehydrogenase
MSTITRNPGAASPAPSSPQRYYRRFSLSERVMHALLMLTFVGCTLTGLPLHFADRAWAAALAKLLGGFEMTTAIHHGCATLMIAVFASHVAGVSHRALRRHALAEVLWGHDSMVPQPQDVIDLYRHVRWFIGKGPRPQFDRWTYWEKFDYWAVFWGMFIIGGSGLLLWFPVFFARFMPGWMFNIAALIHGEEALLAVGFIFTFHFFNGHLRPEKFPMDTVIFSGVVPERELMEERAVEYARLVAEGTLDAKEAPAPARGALWFGRIVGGTALLLGVLTVLIIVTSLLF